jgi:hypothetical protein
MPWRIFGSLVGGADCDQTVTGSGNIFFTFHFNKLGRLGPAVKNEFWRRVGSFESGVSERARKQVSKTDDVDGK